MNLKKIFSMSWHNSTEYQNSIVKIVTKIWHKSRTKQVEMIMVNHFSIALQNLNYSHHVSPFIIVWLDLNV